MSDAAAGQWAAWVWSVRRVHRGALWACRKLAPIRGRVPLGAEAQCRSGPAYRSSSRCGCDELRRTSTRMDADVVRERAQMARSTASSTVAT